MNIDGIIAGAELLRASMRTYHPEAPKETPQ
jgi:hypothetical protein